MDVRIGLVVLLVLAGNWACDARNLVASDLSGAKNVGGNVDVCTMCEEYTTFVLDYLTENKTKTEVLEALHKACSEMYSLKEKCMMLVDYYAPLFFLEVSSVQPEEFCKSVGLCRNAQVFSLSKKQNKCDLCHQTIDEVLVKLQDPDTKLGIIEVLLKACNIMDNYKQKCKSMVFEFGPLILTDAEKFIEKADICNTFHACSKPKSDTEVSADGKIEMVVSA